MGSGWDHAARPRPPGGRDPRRRRAGERATGGRAVTGAGRGARTVRRWPLWLVAAPAAVAVWSGWVGLGTLCGFGVVHPFPGIASRFVLNTAITLPVGV